MAICIYALCNYWFGHSHDCSYTSTIPELEWVYDHKISHRDDEISHRDDEIKRLESTIERLKSEYDDVISDRDDEIKRLESIVERHKSEYDDVFSDRDDEIKRLKSIVGRLKDANFEKFSKEMAKHNPILISDVDVRDESTAFGEKKQAENSTYLTVRVLVASFIEGHYDLYYKLYYPSGKLAQYGKSVDYYIEDYTAMTSMELDSFEIQHISFPSIGNKPKGHWSSGTYKIEIYFRGRCIGTKEFEIY